MVHIRNVPDALHRTLKVRAVDSGRTLSDYLLAELERLGREAHARRDAGQTPQSKARDAEDVGRHGDS
jgi:plasmid stability protein